MVKHALESACLSDHCSSYSLARAHCTRRRCFPLLSDPRPQAIRRTGIVCTIGPESADVQTIVDIRKAGMNIMRLNCAHYSQDVCVP